ncbi:hypothetical protein BV898_19150 [Hypsibius exemplaris]|uniref:Uncharacterized protein n=1 Tax=Hypsibius exemplaris TaxID=2072580 RepID=A0A9X6NL43_HYPEX|nr:hypothetical protein BV898_19150 [Hypsibius exemplaris]
MLTIELPELPAPCNLRIQETARKVALLDELVDDSIEETVKTASLKRERHTTLTDKEVMRVQSSALRVLGNWNRLR